MLFLEIQFKKQIEILENNKTTFKVEAPIVISDIFFDEKFFSNDIRKSQKHNNLFERLQTIKKPVLYWFTINPEFCSSNKIRNVYQNYCSEKHGRNMSSYNKFYDENSITLYVGKVKDGFWGRLITLPLAQVCRKAIKLSVLVPINQQETFRPCWC